MNLYQRLSKENKQKIDNSDHIHIEELREKLNNYNFYAQLTVSEVMYLYAILEIDELNLTKLVLLFGQSISHVGRNK